MYVGLVRLKILSSTKYSNYKLRRHKKTSQHFVRFLTVYAVPMIIGMFQYCFLEISLKLQRLSFLFRQVNPRHEFRKLS